MGLPTSLCSRRGWAEFEDEVRPEPEQGFEVKTPKPRFPASPELLDKARDEEDRVGTEMYYLYATVPYNRKPC